MIVALLALILWWWLSDAPPPQVQRAPAGAAPTPGPAPAAGPSEVGPGGAVVGLPPGVNADRARSRWRPVPAPPACKPGGGES